MSSEYSLNMNDNYDTRVPSVFSFEPLNIHKHDKWIDNTSLFCHVIKYFQNTNNSNNLKLVTLWRRYF